MENYKKISPVLFPDPVVKKESQNGWDIALTYGYENTSLSIIDLSHVNKWEIYDQNLAGKSFDKFDIPIRPGDVILSKRAIVGLYRPSAALIWQLDGSLDGYHSQANMTKVTDGYTLIALIGNDGPRIMEKLTDLDLESPSRQQIRLVQGPLLGVPSKFVLLPSDDAVSGMLISFDRGSGQSVVDAISDAGKEFNLKPAGQTAFDGWIHNFIQKELI